jgi:ABC-type oligopeptide transport system substrate-binding subunit
MKVGHLLWALAAAGLLYIAPVPAQVLRWAAQDDVLTLDPHSQNHATTIALLQHAYEGLTRYDKNFQVEARAGDELGADLRRPTGGFGFGAALGCLRARHSGMRNPVPAGIQTR